jgi:hypothetical protein
MPRCRNRRLIAIHHLLTAAFLLAHLVVCGQQLADTISIKRNWAGITFRQHGQVLNTKELVYVMRTIPAAETAMIRARDNYTPSTVLSFAGGFLIGFGASDAVFKDQPNWSLMGIGAGLVAVSIPFWQGYVRHTSTAVQHFNQGLRAPTSHVPHWRLGMGPHGVGLALTF